jgi:hypothetical protein
VRHVGGQAQEAATTAETLRKPSVACMHKQSSPVPARYLVLVKVDDVLVVPPLLLDDKRVVGPVAVKGLGAVEHLGAIHLTVHTVALTALVELVWPALLRAVNPMIEVAQQIGLVLEHVLLVTHVQDAGPVGAAGVVSRAVLDDVGGTILLADTRRHMMS